MSKAFAGFLMLTSACTCLMSTLFLFHNWHVKPRHSLPLKFDFEGFPWLSTRSVHLGLVLYHFALCFLALLTWYCALKAVSTVFDKKVTYDPESSPLVPGSPTNKMTKTTDSQFLALSFMLTYVCVAIYYMEEVAMAIAEGRARRVTPWVIWTVLAATISSLFVLCSWWCCRGTTATAEGKKEVAASPLAGASKPPGDSTV